MSGYVSLALATIVGATAFAAYLPALWTGFTADDFFILARLKQFGGLDRPLEYFGPLGFFEYYRPLTFLSHALDWEIWRMHPAGFHLTNVGLHAGNAVLVFALGRQLAGRAMAVVAGLLFALHPASHEAVYWISARFDLLATFLSLIALVLACGTSRGYVFGVMAFGLALLAKESALAVPVVVLAHDVLIRRLDWRDAARRLLPFVLVAAAYGLLRSHVGALDAAGGTERLPKLLLLAAMTAGLFWVAHSRPAWSARSLRVQTVVAGIVLAAGLAGALVALPASSGWLREKIGFASFSLFYLFSPVAVPSPPAHVFDRPAAPLAAIELAVLFGVIALAWRNRQWILTHPQVVFLLVFTAATLVPVSSMTSGPRYLYLASTSVSLFWGMVFLSLPRALRSRAIAVVALALAVAVVQLAAAGRSWKWASDMTDDALTLMTGALVPCGAHDIVVLTTPVGIRGVFSNLNEMAFEVRGCSPASWTSLLRVVGSDAHVEVSRTEDQIELRVPEYAGNFVASRDLRHFDLPVTGPEPLSIETPIGRLDSRTEDGARIFRLSVDRRFRQACYFFYSDGRVQSLGTAQAGGLAACGVGQ